MRSVRFPACKAITLVCAGQFELFELPRIIVPMPVLSRSLMIALMLILLPLRGWVGNAMAVDMAAQQVLTAQAGAIEPAPMSADCNMAMQTMSEEQTQADSATAHCHSCDTCELCLALATASQDSWHASPTGRHSAALHAGNVFSSAENALSFKPPIS